MRGKWLERSFRSFKLFSFFQFKQDKVFACLASLRIVFGRHDRFVTVARNIMRPHCHTQIRGLKVSKAWFLLGFIGPLVNSQQLIVSWLRKGAFLSLKDLIHLRVKMKNVSSKRWRLFLCKQRKSFASLHNQQERKDFLKTLQPILHFPLQSRLGWMTRQHQRPISLRRECCLERQDPRECHNNTPGI